MINRVRLAVSNSYIHSRISKVRISYNAEIRAVILGSAICQLFFYVDLTFDTVKNSTSIGVIKNLRRTTQTANVRDAFTGIEDDVRASATFRWLTAEPEPDVIIIDLLDTWTVGPVLVRLERAGQMLYDAITTFFLGEIIRVVRHRFTIAPLKVVCMIVGLGVVGIHIPRAAIDDITIEELIGGLLVMVVLYRVSRIDKFYEDLIESRWPRYRETMIRKGNLRPEVVGPLDRFFQLKRSVSRGLAFPKCHFGKKIRMM